MSTKVKESTVEVRGMPKCGRFWKTPKTKYDNFFNRYLKVKTISYPEYFCLQHVFLCTDFRQSIKQKG